MSDSQIREICRVMPDSPLKKYIEYQLEKTVLDRRMNFDPKTQADFDFNRGVIEGLNIAKGILNRKP